MTILNSYVGLPEGTYLLSQWPWIHKGYDNMITIILWMTKTNHLLLAVLGALAYLDDHQIHQVVDPSVITWVTKLRNSLQFQAPKPRMQVRTIPTSFHVA